MVYKKLNKNNYNDPTNVTNIKPAINQMHTAAPTMNYSYPGSSMMYPHLAGLSSSNPYYSYLNQQQQQQPQLYPYQQQQSTMYNYPQQYAGLQQQFSSQPDVNKRYHFWVDCGVELEDLVAVLKLYFFINFISIK